MKREYAIDNAIVEEFKFDEDGISSKAEFENIEGLRTANKCLFIRFDELCSEVVIHNLSERELRGIKSIVNSL